MSRREFLELDEAKSLDFARRRVVCPAAYAMLLLMDLDRARRSFQRPAVDRPMNNDFYEFVSLNNQWTTNRRLNESNQALAENNRLLEQIRRQLLSPAERAAEDAARAAKHAAKRAADARRSKIELKLLLSLIAVGLVIILFANAKPPERDTFPETAPAPQSTPLADWAPRAELVKKP